MSIRNEKKNGKNIDTLNALHLRLLTLNIIPWKNNEIRLNTTANPEII